MRILCHLSVLLVAGATVASAGGGFLVPADYSGSSLTAPRLRGIVAFADGKQTLILSLDYEGDAKSIAWVIPCPTKPTVRTIESRVFQETADFFNRQRLDIWKRDAPQGLAGEKPTAATVRFWPFKSSSSTSVIPAKELGDWMKKNRMKAPAALKDTLADYTKQGWYLAVLKFRGFRDKRYSLRPTRLTFSTEKPLYPVRLGNAVTGLGEYRLYMYSPRPSSAGKGEWRETHDGAAFIIDDKDRLTSRCTKLIGASSHLKKQPLMLERMTFTLPPQVMPGLDDRLHGDWQQHKLYGAASLGATLGIARALVSSNEKEADWATEQLNHYEGYPKSQLPALRKAAEPIRDELTETLFSAMMDHYRKKHQKGCYCAGRLALLGAIADGNSKDVNKKLRQFVNVFAEEALSAFCDMNTPLARTTLGQFAYSKQKVAALGQRYYMKSLEGEKEITKENAISHRNPSLDDEERKKIAWGLLRMMQKKVLRGEPRNKAFYLLMSYTGQDLGTNVKQWEQWMRKNYRIGGKQQPTKKKPPKKKKPEGYEG